ncbi:MAG: hypothetical protein J6Y20_10200 [Lachnospiraceae bacterium]|nr:hypothetical protein [Lachnospiraceae bacterium]
MAKTPVQQTQPLRVPAGWNQQERMLIVQLEDVFRNLSNQIGVLRSEIQAQSERITELEEAANNV